MEETPSAQKPVVDLTKYQRHWPHHLPLAWTATGAHTLHETGHKEGSQQTLQHSPWLGNEPMMSRDRPRLWCSSRSKAGGKQHHPVP